MVKQHLLVLFFSVYHKERSMLHKRRIPELSSVEVDTHLFRWRSSQRAYTAPSLRETKTPQQIGVI